MLIIIRIIGILFCCLAICACSGSSSEPSSPSSSSSGQVVVDAEPGKPVLRRLNRREYNNTARDLLGSSLKPADKFPRDDISEGFDTLGAALTTTPVLLEGLVDAAGELAQELMAQDSAHPQRANFFACEPENANRNCLRDTAKALAYKAFRRPVNASEIDEIVDNVITTINAQDGSPAEAMELLLTSILASPYYFYQVEEDPEPGSKKVRALSPYELASRLSYAVWSSLPDEELLSAAEDGSLLKDAELSAQVERMLASPKAKGFIYGFADQWLLLGFVESATPNAEAFPSFDEELRASMIEETRRTFATLIEEAKPLSEFLVGNTGFINARLAEHYGIPENIFIAGEAVGGGFRRVEGLDNYERGGYLAQSSFLLASSLPTRRSPVIRGKTVLEQLLCSPPPPPPENVGDLPEETEVQGETLAELLAAHRDHPDCRACHQIIDPPGLAFERYDGIGALRTVKEVPSIPMQEPRELARSIAADDRWVSCVSKQLLTYMVGRAFSVRADQSWVEYIADAGSENDNLPELIKRVVLSDAFRKRVQ